MTAPLYFFANAGGRSFVGYPTITAAQRADSDLRVEIMEYVWLADVSLVYDEHARLDGPAALCAFARGTPQTHDDVAKPARPSVGLGLPPRHVVYNRVVRRFVDQVTQEVVQTDRRVWPWAALTYEPWIGEPRPGVPRVVLYGDPETR